MTRERGKRRCVCLFVWYVTFYLLFVFSLCERKTNNKKKEKYLLAECDSDLTNAIERQVGLLRLASAAPPSAASSARACQLCYTGRQIAPAASQRMGFDIPKNADLLW